MSLKDLLAADINIFLNTADFAVQATYKGVSINVIFDDEYSSVNLQTGAVESTLPRVICKSADIAGAIHGDTIIADGVAYKIIEIQPNSISGLTTLILSRD